MAVLLPAGYLDCITLSYALINYYFQYKTGNTVCTKHLTGIERCLDIKHKKYGIQIYVLFLYNNYPKQFPWQHQT
jgi:hypothetical protein